MPSSAMTPLLSLGEIATEQVEDATCEPERDGGPRADTAGNRREQWTHCA
jgi:hypothetical protein